MNLLPHLRHVPKVFLAVLAGFAGSLLLRMAVPE